jgi:hypothetical protein
VEIAVSGGHGCERDCERRRVSRALGLQWSGDCQRTERWPANGGDVIGGPSVRVLRYVEQFLLGVFRNFLDCETRHG